MDEKQISELLECSVCLERFDQSCKVLPCQHTFCRQCLDEIILTKHELRCPECRALVTVRVSDLPTNILVVRILEGLKTKCQRLTGGSITQHGPGSLSSSPSKGVGSGQVPVYDPISSHSYRQGTQPCAKALYNYDSSEKDDLTFKKGDVIVLRRKIDDNWFQGEVDGRLGYFPANFVQVLIPLPQIPQCVALYDFELRDEGEKDCLSFKKEEMLTVIRRVDDNWLEGRKGDKIGIFPLTFVKLNEAARSLINTKSNLTIHPGLSLSPNSPVIPSGVIVSSGISSSSSTTTTGSNRGEASGTTTATCTLTPSICTTALGCSGISSSGTITDYVLITNSVDEHTTVLTPLDAKTDEPLPDALAVLTGNSQQEPVMATTSAQVSSAPAAMPEVLNKRHSFTSTSMSSPFTTAVTSSDHTPQRHSVEVTLSEEGALALVSSEIAMSLPPPPPSSSSSVVMETQPVTSASQKNTPSSPVTTSEATVDASASPSSLSNVQTGSLTTPVYIALYNYKPRKDDELELHKGDLYTVVEKCQDGWYRGSCLRSAVAGVFPGNYVQLIRYSSAFKPVNPNMLNIRTKAPTVAQPIPTAHSVATGDHRSAQALGENSSQAPPLMPRVAKMSTSGQISRSPLSHLGGTPLRSLSTPGSCPAAASPKHLFSHSSSASSHAPPHMGLSRPLIPAPPPSTTSSPHHSLWVPPSLATMQHSMSTSSNITPPNVVMSHSLDSASSAATLASAGKDKKEKKEKEKKGLVKLLSGKSKKAKQASLDPEPVPPLSVVCFDGGIHSRSASYPVNGTAAGAAGDTSFICAHGKAASFDATTVPPIPAKPRPKLAIRERYCCIVPYPPQTEHELSLELGDIIHIHRKRDDGWYKGTQERTGKTGMFPASFVEKCD